MAHDERTAPRKNGQAMHATQKGDLHSRRPDPRAPLRRRQALATEVAASARRVAGGAQHPGCEQAGA